MLPEDLKYTEEHEWVSLDDKVATIGITEHATEELGEIVFVELPEVDQEVGQMEEIGTLESVKTVSSIYSPLTGKVIEINDDLENNPSALNESPYTNGWIVKLDLEDTVEYDDLMTAEEYQSFLDNL